MLGGYQILDLRNIDLSRSTSASDITNAYVLNQLLKLREHIEKSYDFSRPLNNQLKPVLIRYRDKKVGEKHESAVFGALEVANAYYKFKIVAENNGEKLTIDVEFEEKTYEENEEKYWDIKTAKILLTIDETIGGDASIGGNMSVTGDASIGGDLEVTGKVSGKIAFEDIEDALGHKRFIEGDITIETIEGITQTYGKWSLSGSHLMIVVAGTIEDGTVLTGGSLADINIPDWIFDKLVPIVSNFVVVENKTLIASDYTTQQLLLTLQKSSTKLSLRYGSLTIVKAKSFRFNFDLLIDNEQPNP